MRVFKKMSKFDREHMVELIMADREKALKKGDFATVWFLNTLLRDLEQFSSTVD